MAAVQNNGLLVVISGPSGAGKTTIARALEQRLGGEFSVSVTTRPKTPVDVEGRDYYFIDDAEFARLRDAGDLLEYAKVFGKYCYGTPRGPVEDALRAGRLMILEIDVQGGFQVKRRMPDAFMLFILPPNDGELLKRLRNRGRDTDEAIQRRYAAAKDEIQAARQSNAYDMFIVNDALDRTINEACALVQQRRSAQLGRARADGN